MHKKKVLFMINSMYGGGAEKIFQTLLNNLEPSKYDITVYSVNQCKIDHKYYPENIKYKYIFGGIDESTGQISKIITKIKNKINLSRYEKDSPETFYKRFIKEKYDIDVNPNSIYDVEVAFIEGYATKIISGSNNKDSKKIAWVHIDLMENPWTEVAYHSLEEEKECYQKYDNILGVSEEVVKAFEKRMDIRDTVSVQYNPVDDIEINQKATMDNIEYPSNIKNFVTIGRLVDQKGYDRLLHVVNELKDHFKFCIRILGEGSDREKLEDYIKKNHLEDYVKLLGFQNNPYPYIKAADAFICSSRSEGFSTVATEAMILQKPIFTTDCAGMKELFGEYNCGMICKNSEDGLKRMLEEVFAKENFDEYQQDIKKRSEFFKLERRMKEISDIID